MPNNRDITTGLRRHKVQLCAIPDCPNLRHRLGALCRPHERHMEQHGHPVEKAPPQGLRTQRRKIVRKEMARVEIPADVLAAMEATQRRADFICRTDPRDIDVEAAGRLARTDAVDLLAAYVSWVLHERYSRGKIRPIRDWPMSVGEREKRWEVKQLAIWLRDAMNTRRFPSHAGSYRAMTRVVGTLKASVGLRAELAIENFAASIHPAVREELQRLDDLALERARAKRDAMNPYGIRPDGSFDIYRADG